MTAFCRKNAINSITPSERQKRGQTLARCVLPLRCAALMVLSGLLLARCLGAGGGHLFPHFLVVPYIYLGRMRRFPIPTNAIKKPIRDSHRAFTFRARQSVDSLYSRTPHFCSASLRCTFAVWGRATNSVCTPYVHTMYVEYVMYYIVWNGGECVVCCWSHKRFVWLDVVVARRQRCRKTKNCNAGLWLAFGFGVGHTQHHKKTECLGGCGTEIGPNSARPCVTDQGKL